MDALTTELAVEKGNNAHLQYRLAQSEASSHTDSRNIREQLQANIRRARELEVEVSNPIMLLDKYCLM